ncbi:MAG: TonB family protein [Verrucomicrobia bacterium]|nr:TonB family protein [Verrucomicrobiota bacterium]
MATIELTLPPGAALPQYTLTDDLAQYCLPAASRDENKRLAWANSICTLFVSIGLVGINPPKIEPKVLPPPQDIVPVVYTPPPEEEKPQPQEIVEEEPEPTDTTPLDTPSVATVVAADASAVAFAVPVEGPVVFAPARFASAPPPRPPRPVSAEIKPTPYRRGGRSAINRPEPTYPLELKKEGAQGTIILHVGVDTNGFPTDIDIKQTTGYQTLDRHVAQWIKKHWMFDSGEKHIFIVPFEFRLETRTANGSSK